ncbi:hypothetical protein AMTRI_Chr04g243640 [Amborella trichopoda]
MAAKVEQASAVESRRVQAATSMSTSSSSNPKISMFGAQSGFVIPKNKLSGSLVPTIRGGGNSLVPIRGGGKLDTADTTKEENNKQVQRKTKWGSDLTLDPAVRRGRAFAYQTRVEQITRQLESGIVEDGDDQGSSSPSTGRDPESSDQNDNELTELQLLELEKQEAIGECIRLNPSYKAPPGYKPLLREAKVPIPLKAYPGYNFIGLILGPESNTQKRLEEETEAKVRIHGIKADTGEKIEISQLEGNEDQSVYGDLYVHVSADTYEKVDAAVALIELLVTPVSANAATTGTTLAPFPAEALNMSDQNPEGAPTSYVLPVNQVSPILGLHPSIYQFQAYGNPWRPVNPTSMLSPSNFMPSPNPNISMRFPPATPLNSFNPTAFFRGRPPLGPTFARPHQPQNLAPQRPPFESRPSNQVGPAYNQPILVPQSQTSFPLLNVRPNSNLPSPFPHRPIVGSSASPAFRPIAPSMPNSPSTPPQNRALGTMLSTPMQNPPLQPQNRTLASPSPPPTNSSWQSNPPHLVSHQTSGATTQAPPTSMPLPQGSQLLQTTQSVTPTPLNLQEEKATSRPVAQQNPSVVRAMQVSAPVLTSAFAQPLGIGQGQVPSATPPPIPAPKPQRPSSNDFTFQTRVPPPQAQSVPSSSVPQAPSFRPQVPLSTPNLVTQPTLMQLPNPKQTGQTEVSLPNPSLTPQRPSPNLTLQTQLPLQNPSLAVRPQVPPPNRNLNSSSQLSLPNPVSAARPQLPLQNPSFAQSQVAQPNPNSMPPPKLQLPNPNLPTRPQVQQPNLNLAPRSQMPQPNPNLAARPQLPLANPNLTSPLASSGPTRPSPQPPMLGPTRPSPQPPMLGPLIRPPQNPNFSARPPMPGFLASPMGPLVGQQMGFAGPNQQFRGAPGHGVVGRPGSSGNSGGQSYDPFSPAAISPMQHGNGEERKPKSDAEYDDLMASVGVK